MNKFFTLALVVLAIVAIFCKEDKDTVIPVNPFDTTKVKLTYSDPDYQDHGSKLVGVSTSSFSDANLKTESILKYNPHFMPYYLDSTKTSY